MSLSVWKETLADQRVSQMIVVVDEVSDLLFKVTKQIIIFEQEAILEGLMPALDLAVGLGMHRRTAHLIHAPVIEPISQFAGDVTRAIVAE